jgi:hypothetical protein
MDDWKRGFSERLRNVQSRWVKQFEDTLDNDFVPAFDDLAGFLRNHGFTASMPLREEGRRSFKFELAENAYLLLIVRAIGIGDFELRTESFAPGCEPRLNKATERVADVNAEWARRRFQQTLDEFVEHLSGAQVPAEEALVAV